MRVAWSDGSPAPGTFIVLRANPESGTTLVMTADWRRLGTLVSPLGKSPHSIVAARVTDVAGTVEVEYFHPVK